MKPLSDLVLFAMDGKENQGLMFKITSHLKYNVDLIWPTEVQRMAEVGWNLFNEV